MRGVFITGTDTNVGKTVVAAAVMLRYRHEVPLRYWKPVQTGIRDPGSGIRDPGSGIRGDDDTSEVARLSRASDGEIVNCGVRLRDAVSPHLAARRAGMRIMVRSVTEKLKESDRSRSRWIIEGAGGALVPLNERETMA